jgi:hypothetical protein
MKLKIKLSLVLLTCVAFTYTACKKSGSAPTNTVTAKTVSSQIALNLAQTLYSGFGVFSINDGLNAPNTLGVNHHKGIKLNDINSDPACGLAVDTTLNYSTSLGDTAQASVSGNIKFVFTCTGQTFTGFNVIDNLNVAESTSQLAVSYVLGENLVLTSLNPSDPNSQYSFNGSLNESANLQYKTGSKQKENESYNYTFKSLVIDPTNGIISGSATFSTTGSTPSGNWNYSGTAVFLGNNMVKITINGTAYTVNIQTGQVS